LNSTYEALRQEKNIKKKAMVSSLSASKLPLKIIQRNVHIKETKSRIFPQTGSGNSTPRMMKEASPKRENRKKMVPGMGTFI